MIDISRPQADWLASVCGDAVSAAIEDALDDLNTTDAELADRLRRRMATGAAFALSDVFSNVSSPEIVVQRIEHVEGGVAIGYEALARFGRTASPNEVFAKAIDHGLGVELELVSLRAAVRRMEELPAQTFLGVNLSANALLDPQINAVLDGLDRSRVVIELTQQAEIFDVQQLCRRLEELRESGVVVAVDRAGDGFFRGPRLVELQPSMIKISSVFVSDCDTDEEKRSQLANLIAVGRRIGAIVVATGVERVEERNVVAGLGVDAVQGYFVGRPSVEFQLDAALV